ncbi:MAG: hypothetical protein WDW38_002157 [Sanguina aurantia]
MTLVKLKEICKEAGLPTCPQAVEKLELQCQMFCEIGECLSAYSEVRVLHLERNSLTGIQNLSTLLHLRCLYLNNNSIASIQGLNTLTSLQVLDLSHNQIRRVEGLEGLGGLQVLLLSGNRLTDRGSLERLHACGGRLAELDLSHNTISDLGVLEVLEALPVLSTLTLISNPLSPQADPDKTEQPLLKNYRRTLISRCTHLTALDHIPILPSERAYSQAWRHHQPDQTTSPDHNFLLFLSLFPSQLPPLEQLHTNRPTRFPLSPQTANKIPTPVIASPPAASSSPGARQHTKSALPPALLVILPPLTEVSPLMEKDLLFPVFAKLNSPALLTVALVCGTWAAAAAPLLLSRRREQARERLSRVQSQHAAVSAELVACMVVENSAGDSQQQRLCDMGVRWTLSAPRPLVQLFHALQPLWDKVTGASECGGREAEQQQAGREACLPSLSTEVDMDSESWRLVAWSSALKMLKVGTTASRSYSQRRFLCQLELRQLQTRTGTADDLEGYIPELDASSVGRLSRAAGSLCRWLLGSEAHMVAYIEWESAWQQQLSTPCTPSSKDGQKHLEPVSPSTQTWSVTQGVSREDEGASESTHPATPSAAVAEILYGDDQPQTQGPHHSSSQVGIGGLTTERAPSPVAPQAAALIVASNLLFSRAGKLAASRCGDA